MPNKHNVLNKSLYTLHKIGEQPKSAAKTQDRDRPYSTKRLNSSATPSSSLLLQLT